MPSIAHKFLQLPNTLLGTYNLWDCYNTAQLPGPMIQEMKDAGQWEYYQAVISPLQDAVLDMQAIGIQVDQGARLRLKAKLRKDLNEGDNYIRSVAKDKGFQFNDKFPNSKQQVGKFLFETMGLKVPKRTKTGLPSVDQDTLTRILRGFRKKDEGYRPVIHALFHRSRIQTILSRYLDFTIDLDHRVRPLVKMASVKTYRFAYEDPALQQFPEECRHIFIGRITSADYSQLEARLLAYYSNDLIDIATFEEGRDIHAQTAMEVFDLEQAAWDDMDPETRTKERGFAKTFRYRMVYGGTMASGDKKLYCPCPKCIEHNPPTIDLKPKEMVVKERKWMSKHPWFNRWRGQVANQVRKNHYFPLPLGGRRYISKIWGSELERELSNIPMQMGGAQLMNKSQVELYKLGLPVMLQWHDAFYTDGPYYGDQLRSVMEQPVTIGQHKVVFPVDISQGTNLGKYNTNTNPTGLKEVT